MASITIRDIPDGDFEKLNDRRAVSKSTQLDMWTKLLGSWEDRHSTKDIIHGIYSRRTLGRKVKL